MSGVVLVAQLRARFESVSAVARIVGSNRLDRVQHGRRGKVLHRDTCVEALDLPAQRGDTAPQFWQTKVVLLGFAIVLQLPR